MVKNYKKFIMAPNKTRRLARYMRPKPLEKRITDMLIQDPFPPTDVNGYPKAVSMRRARLRPAYSAKFPGLRDAMNEIENNAKKSDTDKSLDYMRITKLREYFNKKPLLNELHKVYNAWVREQETLSETMRMLIVPSEYDKKYIKAFNEAEKVLTDLDEYLKLVTGEDSSDDAAADSDMATAAVSLAMDAAADSDKAAAAESLGWVDDGDSDEHDPVRVRGTVVPRNAQPRNIITVPGRVVAASSAASSAASLITRAGRKLRTRKRKIHKKKSHKKKSNKKKSKTHRKKQHKKTHRKY